MQKIYPHFLQLTGKNLFRGKLIYRVHWLFLIGFLLVLSNQSMAMKGKGLSCSADDKPETPDISIVTDCRKSTLTIINPAPGATIRWIGPDSGVDFGTSTSIVVENEGDYQVIQTVDGVESDAGLVTMIFVLPDAPVLVSSNNCNGTATITLQNPSGNTIWSTGDAATATSVSVTSSGEVSATVNVNGCEVTTTEWARALNSPNVSVAVENRCNGTSTFTATITGDYNSFFWVGPMGLDYSSTITQPSSSYDVYQAVAFNDECVGSASDVGKLLEVPAKPILSARNNCDGSGTITLDNPSGNTRWSTGDLSTATSVTVNSSQSVTATAISVDGCEVGEEVGVAVGQSPSVTVDVENHCDGTSTFTATIYSPYMDFEWRSVDPIGDNSMSITVPSSNNYYEAYAVDNLGCGSSAGKYGKQLVFATPPTVTSPVTLCVDGEADPLTASGTQLLWYTSVDGMGTTDVPTPSTATAGSTTYYVTESTEDCESEKVAISVEVAACSPLPVTLVAVSVKNSEDAVVLSWKTATEIRSKYYEIERSTNPSKGFITIALMGSKNNGNGASYTYSDSDFSKSSEIIYYRLKMVDQNGTFAYSSIQGVRINSKIKSEIYPNPVSQLLTIHAVDWKSVTRINIRTTKGDLVYQSKKGVASSQIDISQLAPAIYLVELQRSKGDSEFLRFVVAR